MNFKKIVAALSIFALTAVGFAGCGEEEKQVKADDLKIGTSLDFLPFEFHDSEEKEYQGFDMDIIYAIGRELGRPVQVGSINFDGLIPSLQAGNVDVVIAAMTINDERKKLVAFSDPYYESGLTIMVRSNESEINSFEDLAGKKIGVIVSSTAFDMAKTIPDAQVFEYENSTDSFPALKSREVDALINDRPVNDYAIATNQVNAVKVLPDLLTNESYGIAVRKDDTEMLQKINEALKKLHDTGEYDQIYSKWFGTR